MSATLIENDIIDAFARAISATGMVPPVDLVPDGRLHRFNPDGRGKDRSGTAWYVLHADNVPAGIFGDWRHPDAKQTWCSKANNDMTPQEQTTLRETIRAMHAARHADMVARQEQAAGLALQRWQAAAPAPVDHAYLVAKGVQPHGIRAEGDALLVPVRDAAGRLRSLQTIYPDGGKRFLPGGKKQGGYFALGGKPDGVLVIAEGFATAASIHQATGLPVATAFDAGNLQPVAVALHAKHPALALVIAADDDWQTEGNPGLTQAKTAALAVGGQVVKPRFPAGRPPKATDFNDLHALAGPDAVRACFANILEDTPC
jgi:putative DNA primase/helicase